MIEGLIARQARKAFAGALRFEGGAPRPPSPARTQGCLLYLHIPFCERLCPYCSFHRVPFAPSLAGAYFQALRREIRLYHAAGFSFSGIYAGGGTPTVLPDELGETIELCRACFPVREISVETNPNHLTEDRISSLSRMGVNRLSVGVQSFDDGLLRSMDRYDRYGSGREIADRLRGVLGRFETVNADMLFNLPGQTEEILDADLQILTGMSIDQATFYPLMVSDTTREEIHRSMGPTDPRREGILYRRIARRLGPAYDMSSAWCFSRKGRRGLIDEYIVDYDDYAGLGSGAIGYVNGTCYANTFDLETYANLLSRGVLPVMASRVFSERDRARYDFIMKMFGTSLVVPDLEKRYEGRLFRHIWQDVVAFHLAGSLRYWAPRFVLTERGRYHWVILMREFFTAVNNFRDFCRGGIPNR